MFAFSIGKSEEASSVSIGSYDLEQHSDGNLQWHDLLDTNYWLLPMNNSTIQGVPVKTSATSVIIDTGTSLVLLPENDFASILSILRN